MPQTRESRIEYRHNGRDCIRLWTRRQGTKKEILESARGLLRELREDGYNRAQVFVDGKTIRLRGGTED